MDDSPLTIAEPSETVAEPAPHIRHGWLRALLSLPVWVLAQVVASLVALGLMGGDWDMAGVIGRPLGIAVQAVVLSATLAVVLIFRKLIDRRSILSLGLPLSFKGFKDLVAGIIWGIALISIIFLVVILMGGVRVIAIGFPSAALVNMTMMMAIVAISEELFVRGYVLNNLMASGNRYIALLLSSLVFGLGHFLNPNASVAGLVNIILAGLLLGIYYIHRQNLWFPIGLHFSWNLFQGAVYGSAISGVKAPTILQTEVVGSELLTGGSFGLEASLVTTLILSLAVFALHRLYRPSDPRLNSNVSLRS